MSGTPTTSAAQPDAGCAPPSGDDEYEARVQRRIVVLLAKLPPLSEARVRRIRQALTIPAPNSGTDAGSGSATNCSGSGTSTRSTSSR